jgi:hypothetical protein
MSSHQSTCAGVNWADQPVVPSKAAILEVLSQFIGYFQSKAAATKARHKKFWRSSERYVIFCSAQILLRCTKF